jgi:hypothetical protein
METPAAAETTDPPPKLLPPGVHGPDDDCNVHPECVQCQANVSAERLKGEPYCGELGERDVRAAITLAEALNERVAHVTAVVNQVRRGGPGWDVQVWEVRFDRARVEVIDVTTSYWFHGDTHPSQEHVVYPLAYLWDAEPRQTETQAVTAARLAKEQAEREAASSEAARQAQERSERLRREVESPTCRGCGKPATGEVIASSTNRVGLVPCCEACGLATGAAGAYHAWKGR